MKKVLFIRQDDYSDSPREWSNIGTIAYKHPRYRIGDVVMSEPIDYLLELLDKDEHWLEIAAKRNNSSMYSNETYTMLLERAERAGFIILPVYLYDHSGITISTSPFGCHFDSGQVGIIHTNMKAMQEIGFKWKNWTKERRALATTWLEGEIKIFDQYLRGDVYRFCIKDENGDVIDSCGGFYGDDLKTNGMLNHIEGDLEDYEIKYEWDN